MKLFSEHVRFKVYQSLGGNVHWSLSNKSRRKVWVGEWFGHCQDTIHITQGKDEWEGKINTRKRYTLGHTGQQYGGRYIKENNVKFKRLKALCEQEIGLIIVFPGSSPGSS
jgi:hypothetical protein